MDKIFQLDIDPVGKGRPRVTSFGGRPRMYTPAKTRSFENAIGRVASRHLEKIDGPLRVDILAITTRPKRLKRKKDSDKVIYRTTKPDADNVRKAVLDGLSPFFDDKQVVSGGDLQSVLRKRRQRKSCYSGYSLHWGSCGRGGENLPGLSFFLRLAPLS